VASHKEHSKEADTESPFIVGTQKSAPHEPRVEAAMGHGIRQIVLSGDFEKQTHPVTGTQITDGH